MNNVHPLFQGIINSHFPTNVEEAEIVEEEEEEDMEDKLNALLDHLGVRV